MKYVTVDKYIQELNNELKTHDSYEEGMKFLTYPEGANGTNMTGYIFKESKSNIIIFADVASIVSKKYGIQD